jgi:hypothetical protein
MAQATGSLHRRAVGTAPRGMRASLGLPMPPLPSALPGSTASVDRLCARTVHQVCTAPPRDWPPLRVQPRACPGATARLPAWHQRIARVRALPGMHAPLGRRHPRSPCALRGGSASLGPRSASCAPRESLGAAPATPHPAQPAAQRAPSVWLAPRLRCRVPLGASEPPRTWRTTRARALVPQGRTVLLAQ